MLRGLVRRAGDPFGDRTAELLTAAVGAFREQGNVAGEVAASMELAYVCRVRGETAVLPGLMLRAVELHERGHHEVEGGMALGRAAWAEIAGDDEQYLVELASVPPDSLSLEWRAAAAQMEFTGHLTLGHEEAMLDAARRCASLGGSHYTGRHTVAVAEWFAGRPRAALDTLDEIRADATASRVDRLTLGAFATLVLATSGRLGEAKSASRRPERRASGAASPS